MSSGSDQRVRHVAIVLQSLDSATSRGLLSQLPPEQSKMVRQAMVNLGAVSSQERAAAFESMQGLLSAAGIRTPAPARSNRPPSDSPSPAAALLAAQSHQQSDQVEWSEQVANHSAAAPRLDVPAPDSQWQLPAHYENSFGSPQADAWQNIPSEVLADLLQGERPIVIATVINQISADRAATIVQALPMSVAGATLAALPHLHLTDPAILRDIQVELERKIGQHAPPNLANAEGIAKLQAILANLPPTQFNIWTNAVAQSNPMLASKLGWIQARSNLDQNSVTSQSDSVKLTPPVAASSKPALSTPAPSRGAADDIFEDAVVLPFPLPESRTSQTVASNSEQTSSEKLNNAEPPRAPTLDNLKQLSDQDFVTVLHACSPQTVLIALSGASREVVKRVERLIPSKDLKRLRHKLANMGPLRLRDVDDAQNQIYETAMKLLTLGKIGALENVSFTAAA